MGIEIERRFAIDDPDGAREHADSEQAIDQGYVAVDDDTTQVRVRRIGERCVLTAKRGAGESRFEHEFELVRADFDALWELTEGRRVRKRRLAIPGPGGLKFEVDVYEDDLAGLAVVEVEFESSEQAAAFEPPSWFGRELTGDDRYSNVALATNGLPAEARA